MTPNPLIIALDVDCAAEARRLVSAIGHNAGMYKVGLELFTAAGPDFVRELTASGHEVFVDLKMFDIGETVKRAAAQVAKLGARFLTVHASSQVVRAAVEGRGVSKLQILGITVLTSFDEHDLADMGYSGDISSLVELRASHATAAGADGLVCSPLEAASLRKLLGPSTLLVTPGVRSPGASKGDQKRVATPAEAIAAGANYLVIGREITRADNPAAEAQRILRDIS